jgi:predicted phage baseplate assembly protein
MSCHCCRGPSLLTPLDLTNRPGLSALIYRVGTYSSFFETMKTRLSSPDFALDSGDLPLAALTTRDSSDPAIALLDAWAIVGDVLTFYQERMVNEGYLRTATEQQSIINLAQLVGYALRPGVSASVFLAYTLEASSQATIPAGSRVQSTPPPGALPQSFETSSDLDARGGWNNLPPRLTRPQVIQADSTPVYLAGVNTNLKPNDPVLIVASPPQPRRVSSIDVDFNKKRTMVSLFPLLKSTATEAESTSAPALANTRPGTAGLELSLVSAVELATPLSKPPANHPANSVQLRRSVNRTFRPEMDTAPALLTTFNPKLAENNNPSSEALPAPAQPRLYAAMRNTQFTPPLTGEFHALRVQAAPFGHNAPLRPITNDQGVVVGTEEWPLIGSLSIRITMTSRAEGEVEQEGRLLGRILEFTTREGPNALVQISSAEASGTAVVSLKVGEFSTKIGKWEVAVKVDNSLGLDFSIAGHQYLVQIDQGANAVDLKIDHLASKIRVPLGESSITASPGRRTLVSLAKGILIDDEVAIPPVAANVLSLDMVYDQLLPGSWVLITRADKAQPMVRQVMSVQKVSLKNYGMTTRVTQLILDQDWLDPKTDLMLDVARNTAVSAQSEQLPLAEEPILDSVPVNQTDQANQIELGNLYDGLTSGRWLIVRGERADLPGVTGAELVMLDNVQQGVQQIPAGSTGAPQDLPGDTTHSFLQFSSPLSYQYKRDTVAVYGNVVQATHGETRKEILGSGDGAQEMQQFNLHQGPITYVAAPTAGGTESTLDVQVNGVSWKETATLAAAGPNDRVFTTQADAAGKRTITFGNGKHGMRLPTGQANVTATYRFGLGTGGNAEGSKVTLLATRPAGVKSVTNPIPASGGADGDTIGQARQNTPAAVVALDRLVSVSDYGDFARTFAGIGKASSGSLSDGHRQLVFVTIAGTEGSVIEKSSALYVNLVQAFQELGAPHLPIVVEISEFMLLVISAQVKVLPDCHFDEVAGEIRAALLDAFSFDHRELAQSIPLSQVISVIQNIRGVQYVAVQVLDCIREADTRSADLFSAKLQAIATARGPKSVIDVPPARLDKATGKIQPAALAFLSPDLPDTFILTEITV